MKVVLFGVAALLQLPGPAVAPDWRIVADGSNGSQLSADVTRSSCKAAICSSTELTEYLRPLPNGASKAVDDVQYDCAQLTTRTLSETSFDVRGKQIAHVGTPTAWVPVPPNSIGFQSMAYACTARHAAPPQAPANARAPQTSTMTAAMAQPSNRASLSAATAQIASSPTASGAQSALAALAEAHPVPTGLSSRVEKAIVHGHATYRALVTGFASQTVAAEFCQQVHDGDGCLVRADKADK